MDAVAAKVEDTAGAAQPSQTPPVEFEIVDTPTPAPEAAAPAAPQLYFGKYKSLEDAEEGLKSLERTMHEKAQEAATYRKLLDERATPPTPQYQPPAVDMDSQFRERLAENPAATIFEMTKFATKQMLDEQQKTQRELVRKYQTYASRPEYASIAQQVAAQLPFANEAPIDPVEGVFMRQRLAQLEEMAKSGTLGRTPNPQYVEPAGSASRAGTNSMRVELDPDTAKLHLGQEKLRELAKMVARQKSAGGSMTGMSIDDWERSNA